MGVCHSSRELYSYPSGGELGSKQHAAGHKVVVNTVDEALTRRPGCMVRGTNNNLTILVISKLEEVLVRIW